MFVAHVTPLNPAAQLQVKLLIPSTHVPPFKHDPTRQSLMLLAHVTPLNPVAQLHV
jgi:hypothetical protein